MAPKFSKGIQLLFLLLILAVIPATVYIAQQQQDIRQRAQEGPATQQFPPITPVPVYQQRVDAGATGDFTDSFGRVWSSDRAFTDGGYGYVGGASYRGTEAVANTIDDSLYATARAGQTFEYRFSVPSGTYEVTLKLAEIEPTRCAVGARVFNVTAEGNTVVANNDTFAQAGCATALDKTFTTIVHDGILNLQFTAVTGLASVNAIEVVSETFTFPAHAP